ncbi:MAG: hypothetical protein Q8S84_09280 [bacterium]|nr:hypothetical protein [bacterium]MDP3381611.1 hypothetical protein [bacterium]
MFSTRNILANFVLPGSELVFTNHFFSNNEFIILDLPTFDLPTKTISLFSSIKTS